jgi:hypothetical protein
MIKMEVGDTVEILDVIIEGGGSDTNLWRKEHKGEHYKVIAVYGDLVKINNKLGTLNIMRLKIINNKPYATGRRRI